MLSPEERFQKVSAGIQSLVVAIAVIIGGIWTYHTFGAELHVENAQAQLDQFQRALAREPHLVLEIDVDPPSHIGTRRFILGRLKLTNSGTGAITVRVGSGAIRLSEVALGVLPVQFTELVGTSLYYEPKNELVAFSVDPNSEKSAAFAFEVKNPGVYFLSFSSSDLTSADATRTQPPTGYQRAVVSASRYVVVN
jgi:hypothetical protein